jgi:hypothetical protein
VIGIDRYQLAIEARPQTGGKRNSQYGRVKATLRDGSAAGRGFSIVRQSVDSDKTPALELFGASLDRTGERLYVSSSEIANCACPSEFGFRMVEGD